LINRLFIIYIAFTFPSVALAGGIQMEIPGSFHPTGYGARSKGMGSAFTGLCDDATAVSHNPAGLIQLRRPEFSIVYRYTNRYETITHFNHTKKHPAHDKDLDYFSFTYPFRSNDMDMGFTVAYQHLYEFQRHWHFTYKQDDPPFQETHQMAYDQTGRLTALGFSFCIGLTPRLSFGVTLNIWDDDLTDNQWYQSYRYDTIELYQGELYDEDIMLRDEQYAISGLNANLGILWEFHPGWRLGIVIKTPFHADLEYQKIVQRVDQNMNPIGEATIENIKNNTLAIPMSFGIGVSYRMSESLLFTTDLYQTLWDDFWIQTNNESKISPVLGQPLDESHIKSAIQVRMGMEYLYADKQKGYAVPIRLGGYYDPVPWEYDSQDYWGITFGSGIEILKYQQLSLDIAYEYRWGEKPVSRHPLVTHYSEKSRSHQFYASLTVYLM